MMRFRSKATGEDLQSGTICNVLRTTIITTDYIFNNTNTDTDNTKPEKKTNKNDDRKQARVLDAHALFIAAVFINKIKSTIV